MKKYCTVWIFIFLSHTLAAQEHRANAFNAAAQNVSKTEVSRKIPVNESLRSTGQFLHFSFLSADKEYFGADENVSALSALSLRSAGQFGSNYLDVQFLHSAQEEESYFNVREIYKLMKLNNNTLVIGRHLHRWSDASAFWDLGIWQPRFLWDKINQEEQGLTGLFFKQDRGKYQLNFFVSFLNFPDQEPIYYEEDGRVLSKNPWFRSLPRSARVLGQYRDINSKIIRPDNDEVIFQPSLAVQLGALWSPSLSTQIAYGYKPVHQILGKFDYYLQSQLDSENGVDIAMVQVYPEFPFHHVGSIESTWENVWGNIQGALIHQEPVVKDAPINYIAQDLPPATVASLVANWYLDKNLRERGKVYAGLVKVWEPTPRDRGEDASDQSQFDRRYPYYLAARAGVEQKWGLKRNRTLVTQVEGTYDHVVRAALFVARGTYQWDKNKQIGFRIQSIGAIEENTAAEYEKVFLRSFRANDNVGMDFSYVF